MQKSGAFSVVVFLIFIILGIVIFSLFNQIQEEKPLFEPPVIEPPKNCSNESVKDVWNLMFKEDSTGINIVTNTSRQDYCESYYAWKKVGNLTYVLIGFFTNMYFGGEEYTNSSLIYGLWANSTDEINSSFLELNSSAVREGYGLGVIVRLLTYAENYSKNWSMAFTPDGVFSSKFKYTNESAFDIVDEGFSVFRDENEYTIVPGGSNYSYIFHDVAVGGVHSTNQTAVYYVLRDVYYSCEPEWACTNWSECIGGFQNRSCSDQKNCEYVGGFSVRPCAGCTPSWMAVNATPCNASESFVIWYNDTNRCNNATSRPANTTGYCDYNKNGLIGRVENVNDVNLNINVLKINGSDVNYSKNYSGERTIQLIEEEDDVEVTRVRFEYDFDDSPLNLYTIKIEKQNDESDFGYLIVEGLSDVSDKDFRVDRVYDSNVLCIRDSSSINSPDDISENCDGTGEYEIYCPGKKNKFNCTDGGDGTYLIIGLDNSGVRELEDGIVTPPPPPPPGNTTCQQNWDCGLWTTCASGQQSRICTDLSTCPNVTKSRNETQTCSSGCTADWECGEWTPADCSEGEEQTQECNDANGCEAAETRTRDCVVEDGGGSVDWTLIAIIIGAAVVVLGAVILIIILKRRKDDKEAEEKTTVFPVLQRPAIGSYSPPFSGGYGGYGSYGFRR